MESIEPIRYSIVVPLYNEEQNVGALYSRIVMAMEEFDDRFQIIFVDDGSRDGTYGTVSEICQSDSRVVLIRLRRNFGQTAAL